MEISFSHRLSTENGSPEMFKLLFSYFEFSNTERKGILFLIFLLLLLLGLPALYPFLISTKKQDFADFQADITAFEKNIEAYRKEEEQAKKRKFANSNFKSRKKYPFSLEEKSNAAVDYFNFDPNRVSKEQLLTLGLSGRTAQSIINYRKKGGVFRTKEDLKKIYTLAEEDYEKLKPYIQLDYSHSNKKPTTLKEFIASEPFTFDPNTASRADFRNLGLSERTAKHITNYREKGGVFRTQEDLKKIYTLAEEDYERLMPYIRIESPKKNDSFSPSNKARPSELNLDINQATVEDFKKLKGIGNSYAKRIVRFRSALGGFINVEQISHVYGLPDSTYQKIVPQLRCPRQPIRQTNINTATAAQLQKNPYLSWQQANAIVLYRKENGNYSSVEMLQVLDELDDGKQTYQKVAPYLSVKN